MVSSSAGRAVGVLEQAAEEVLEELEADLARFM